MQYIYLLHFHRPIHHAQHYAGTTTDIVTRLNTHAAGRGSVLTREFHKRGVGFKLARLWMLPEEMKGSERFRLERTLKSLASGPDWCTLCNHQPRIWQLLKKYELPVDWHFATQPLTVDQQHIR